MLRVPNVKGHFPPFTIDGEAHEWQDVPRQTIKIGDDVAARVAVAHTLDQLWILAEVDDPSPWKNAFKTGDAIDLRNARSGLRIRGDIGVLWGNEAGLVTERRTYLFNHSPGASIVSDTPTEAELQPAEWGMWIIE